jgi:hypothetical protein
MPLSGLIIIRKTWFVGTGHPHFEGLAITAPAGGINPFAGVGKRSMMVPHALIGAVATTSFRQRPAQTNRDFRNFWNNA